MPNRKVRKKIPQLLIAEDRCVQLKPIMKRNLTILCILLSFNAFSQSAEYLEGSANSVYTILFGNIYNEEIRYIKEKQTRNEYKFNKEQEKKLLNKCLKEYSVLSENIKDEFELNRILIRMGILNYKLKDYTKSIGIFKSILGKEINWYFNSISNSNLIELYILTNQFQKALNHSESIDLSHINYNCGNAENEDIIYNTLIMTKIHSGLNQNNKALDYGLSMIFNAYSTKELVPLTNRILLQEYNKSMLKIELERAIVNLEYSKKEKDIFTTKFLDREIELGFFSTNNIEDIDQLRLYLKESPIYKLINE